MCEICGELGREVNMIGGLCMTICNKHRNEWHEHCLKSLLVASILRKDAELMTLVHKGEVELAGQMADTIRQKKEMLYKESKHWIESKKGEQE